MSNHLAWTEIALRLGLTVLGAALIGFNRGEHGHAAGLRTTILVCLAASLSMIQANLLLPMSGKAPDSYVVLDLMRLPLGILSGMGFIGAGAILRRGSHVEGVTTAATLWFVTVMGLCFGGGQLGLGAVACGLGFLALQALRAFENVCKLDQQATLMVATSLDGPSESEITETVRTAGYEIASPSLNIETAAGIREFRCRLRWHDLPGEFRSPPFVTDLAQGRGVLKVTWHKL